MYFCVHLGILFATETANQWTPFAFGILFATEMANQWVFLYFSILFATETAYFGILFTTETVDHTIHIKSKAEKGFLVFLRFVVFCFLYFEMVHSSSGSQRELSEFYFVF